MAWDGLPVGTLKTRLAALEAMRDSSVRRTTADGVTTAFATSAELDARIAALQSEVNYRSFGEQPAHAARRRSSGSGLSGVTRNDRRPARPPPPQPVVPQRLRRPRVARPPQAGRNPAVGDDGESALTPGRFFLTGWPASRPRREQPAESECWLPAGRGSSPEVRRPGPRREQ